jgi:hypothetical protein
MGSKFAKVKPEEVDVNEEEKPLVIKRNQWVQSQKQSMGEDAIYSSGKCFVLQKDNVPVSIENDIDFNNLNVPGDK